MSCHPGCCSAVNGRGDRLLQNKAHFFIKTGGVWVSQDLNLGPLVFCCLLKKMAAERSPDTPCLEFRQDKHMVKPDTGRQLNVFYRKGLFKVNEGIIAADCRRV